MTRRESLSFNVTTSSLFDAASRVGCFLYLTRFLMRLNLIPRFIVARMEKPLEREYEDETKETIRKATSRYIIPPNVLPGYEKKFRSGFSASANESEIKMIRPRGREGITSVSLCFAGMEQFEQLLTCAICLDRYRNPKLLPCQHSFCMEPCMDGLVDYVRRQVKCPECRAEHRIPYQVSRSIL